MHAGERGSRNHVAPERDGIMLDDAQVGQSALADLLQQTADAGGVHLDAEVIVLRMRGSDERGGLAHAEADFQDLRGRPSEDPVEV